MRLDAHVLVRPGADCHAVRRQLEQLVEDRFGIGHTTLQVDHQREGALSIGGTRSLGAETGATPGGDASNVPPASPAQPTSTRPT